MIICLSFQTCLEVCVSGVFYAGSGDVSVWLCSLLKVPLFVSIIADKFVFTCG